MASNREIVVGRKNQKFAVLDSVGFGQRPKSMPDNGLIDRTQPQSRFGLGSVGGSVKPASRPAWLANPSEAPAVAVVEPEDPRALAEWEDERMAIQEADGIFDGPPPTHGPGEWLAELNRLMGRS